MAAQGLASRPAGDDPAGAAPPRLVEVGWLVADALEGWELEALAGARSAVLDVLRKQLGQFVWRMPVVRRERPAPAVPEEPVALLREGLEELDAHHWDFALVVTRADLRSYERPYALAVPSQAVDAAVVSLARLAPEESEPSAGTAARSEALARRLRALVLHLLGHLNGLPHRDEEAALMRPPRSAGDLDAMERFDARELGALSEALAEVADLRLEERPDERRRSAVAFLVRAAWINADEIGRAVAQARPWQFPLRLARLTAAALSALLLLLVTAEAWDLGMGQPASFLAGFAAGALVLTTAFVVRRQKLLLRRRRRVRTEQTVTTNVTSVLVVLLGLATTWILLFATTAVLALTLFGPELAAAWAPVATGGAPSLRHYLALAATVATLGMLVGALGASFEGQHYFQHVIYADEET